ncbi:Hypothetical protein HVR_LOCUS767 [uncultured virus]|nr:Hypothetical protein HVR_LOCUS767 [uncultured virus]
MLYSLYILTGISGSGKTTLGRQLAAQISAVNETKCLFVDEDEHYLEDKPFVKLSDGKMYPNWDTLKSINPNFTSHIRELLKFQHVLLVGFSLPKDILPQVARVHIHLVTALNRSDLENRCVQARIEAKSFINQKRDLMMVREVVIPFYHEMVRNCDITHFMEVFQKNGNRVSVPDLVSKAMKIINKSKVPEPKSHDMEISEPYHSLIKSGVKSVEGRKITPKWRKIRCGDTITITCDQKSRLESSPVGLHTCNDRESFKVRVTGVSMYLPSVGDPLETYLKKETLDRALPGVSSIEEGKRIYLQWSHIEEIQAIGMMGIQVEVVQ